jgi:hypothetical protein
MALITCLARHDPQCYGCGDPSKWRKDGLVCIDCRQFKIADSFVRPLSYDEERQIERDIAQDDVRWKSQVNGDWLK